tara:strand:- start:4431 stop:4748 length:318 start_codon:yes stop_codon:yes gene_type:complete
VGGIRGDATGFRAWDALPDSETLPPPICAWDRTPIYSPWPDGQYYEIAAMPKLATPEMVRAYVHAIQQGRAKNLAAKLCRNIGPINGGFSVANLCELREAPEPKS